MQSSINTSQQCHSLTSYLKIFELKVMATTFALLLTTAGLLATGNVYAADRTAQSTQTLATNDTVHSGYLHKRDKLKHESRQSNDAASVGNASDDNNKLGGYSLQDGAMEGLYGDGEYAD